MLRSPLISIFLSSFFAGFMPANAVAGTRATPVADLVTPAFFHWIVDQTDGGCPAGKSYYSLAAFVQALSSYPQFGKVGSDEDSKREVAAFFAHLTQQTEYFCYIVERTRGGSSKDYCDQNFRQEPCPPGSSKSAFDKLNLREAAAKDPVVSFKTALRYWTNNVQSVMTHGFGATIRAMDGKTECDGGDYEVVQRRVGYYIDYCNQLGVSPGENLYC